MSTMLPLKQRYPEIKLLAAFIPGFWCAVPLDSYGEPIVHGSEASKFGEPVPATLRPDQSHHQIYIWNDTHICIFSSSLRNRDSIDSASSGTLKAKQYTLDSQRARRHRQDDRLTLVFFHPADKTCRSASGSNTALCHRTLINLSQYNITNEDLHLLVQC
ncbi:uncharacterized protein LOC142585856 [Dermacentor variabilis]|uniref:uncharacterized protein LOC142585856 n=1 Tax=Dermacentor variabilis TaxID=34621 RepID=UPI003F5C33AF